MLLIHSDRYKNLPGVCLGGNMSQMPTRFEILDARDVMWLQAELDLKGAGTSRQVAKNKRKPVRRVDTVQRGDWHK